MVILRLRVLSSLLFWILLASGCSSSKIVNQWSDPDYRPSAFRSLVVLGVSRQASIRRSFEDEFVAQLKTEGIEAIPSYKFLPEGQADENRLTQAVKQAGADAAIITRLVRVDRRTQVTPGRYEPFPTYGFYRWYSSAWTGYYEPPRVYNYEVYVSETSLYDLARDRMVWAGTVTTTDPDNIDEEIRNYVRIVIAALKEQKLLVAGGR